MILLRPRVGAGQGWCVRVSVCVGGGGGEEWRGVCAGDMPEESWELCVNWGMVVESGNAWMCACWDPRDRAPPHSILQVAVPRAVGAHPHAHSSVCLCVLHVWPPPLLQRVRGQADAVPQRGCGCGGGHHCGPSGRPCHKGVPRTYAPPCVCVYAVCACMCCVCCVCALCLYVCCVCAVCVLCVCCVCAVCALCV
jgi:hypothetical protein